MNEKWALDQLREYLEFVKQLSSSSPATPGKKAQIYSEINHRLMTVQEIMDRVRPGLGKTAFVRRYRSAYATEAAETAVEWVIGDLERRAEREANLRTPAPKLSADELHPWVWEPARSLWDTTHYREAVQAAATLINAKVQQLVRRTDESDANLMKSVFSEQDPRTGQPRLRWPGNPTDLTVRAMNNGIRGFAVGLFSAVRNPATHSTGDTSRQEALEQLAALSLLARWIEQCIVLRVPGE